MNKFMVGFCFSIATLIFGVTKALAVTVIKRDVDVDISKSSVVAIYRVDSSRCIKFANGPGCKTVKYSMTIEANLRGNPKKRVELFYNPAVSEVIPVGTSALLYEIKEDGAQGGDEVFRAILPIARLRSKEVTRNVVLLDSMTESKRQHFLWLSVSALNDSGRNDALISEDSGRGNSTFVFLDDVLNKLKK